MKRICSLFLSLLTVISVITCVPISVSSANYSTDCLELNGSNIGANGYAYGRWAKPMKSFISVCSDGRIMTVSNDSKGIVICYYNSDYSYAGHIDLAQELPLFGGFYETENNYFILSGQENPSESAKVEVFRVTKYDKNWKRISSVGLKDCNTVVPFSAGSARFTHIGKYLYIRTAHKMYASSDGKNHQANVTISVDMDKMTITDSFTRVSSIRLGYVSHSFNQFVKIDDGKLVAVDHGDAYPRSIVLTKYFSGANNGTFSSNGCSNINLINFLGDIGDNDTGATVGGFEVSSSSYIVAGSSVVLDKNFKSYSTRNIYVASVSKNSTVPTVTYITNYAERTATCSNPHLVKISNNRFLLMWSRENKVHYTELDEAGKQKGSIYTMNGSLSDCSPIVNGSKVIWFTNDNETFKFYSINTQSLDKTTVKSVNGGHEYSISGQVQNGYANLVCKKCGQKVKKSVITDLEVLWQISPGSVTYSTDFESMFHVGETYRYWVQANDRDDTVVVELSDESIATITHDGDFGDILFLKNGVTTITFRSKYNPAVSATFMFKVAHTSDGWIIDKNATVHEAGKKHLKCNVCGKTYNRVVIPQLKPATPKLTKIQNTVGGVNVTWSKVNGADSYIVYRKDYNAKTKSWGAWTRVKGGVTGTSYLDKTAQTGTDYIYTVRATNEAGNSGYNTSGIKTYFLSTPVVTTANSNSGVTVKWGKIVGANGYVVYRKTTGGWTKIATVKGNGTVSYTDKTAKAGVTYKYTVRAYYGKQLSSYNATGSEVRRLATPTLKSVKSEKNGVTFSWTKVTGATGYIVYRKNGNGGWQRISTVKDVSKVSYLDKTAKKGVTYCYTVKAYYSTFTSAYNTKGLTIKDKY